MVSKIVPQILVMVSEVRIPYPSFGVKVFPGQDSLPQNWVKVFRGQDSLSQFWLKVFYGLDSFPRIGVRVFRVIFNF